MLNLIATSAFGLEAVVKFELLNLGYEARIVSPGKICFQAEPAAITRANLWLRSADRIQIEMARFEAKDFDTLFETTKTLAWEEWIPADGQFPVVGRSRNSQLTSVPALQRTIKRAIVDTLQAKHQAIELPETKAIYKIEIALLNDEATLTLDTTGPSLHKRGYRTLVGLAPLKETMAAALIQLSFWKPGRALIDPFCGIGTIPVEAALIGRNRAPGIERTFASEEWPTLAKQHWSAARDEARALEVPRVGDRLIGNDIDENSLKMSRYHAARAGVEDDIHFQQKPFNQIESRHEYGCVVTNPPYGERVGERDEMFDLYSTIPEVLRVLPTWSHFILTAFPNFEKFIQKTANRRRKLYNGRIECTYFQFHGPKPESSQTEQRDPNAESPAPSTEQRAPSTEQRDPSTEQRDPNADDRHQQPGDLSKEIPVATAPPFVSMSVAPAAETATEQAAPAFVSDLAEPPIMPQSEEQTPQKKKPVRPPVFGGLTEKSAEQAGLLRARLSKRAKHLRKWPTKQDIHCFRLYERDIPEIPLIIDRYQDHLHIAECERPHDRDLAQHSDWLELMVKTAAETLDIDPKKAFLKRRLRQRGDLQHERISTDSYEIEVREGGLKFLVNLSDYLDTGLFLDHRITRAMVRDASQAGRVLNLFAYTGSFSVYAADAPAKEVTTVDWSNTYVSWAERNMAINQFQGPQYKFYRADVREFLENLSADEFYDVIVVDPPTFSNSKRTEEVWQIQDSYAELLNLAINHLNPAGSLFFSTNFRRFKFDESLVQAEYIREISRQTVPQDFRNRRIHRCWVIRKTT